MLGKIIYAAPVNRDLPLFDYIVVEELPSSLLAVPVDSFDSFDVLELPHDEWEILGEKVADGEILSTIECIHATFIEPGEVKWSDKTVAQARETITLLEHAIEQRPCYDGELGEAYLDEDDDSEDEARAAGEAAAEEMVRRRALSNAAWELVGLWLGR